MIVGNEFSIKRKDHFLFLDVIKFLSAILIVFHHYQQDLSVHFPYLNFYSGNIYFGYLVELFFVISGFLAAYDAERYGAVESCKLKDYAKTWIHKAKRIYPMAIFSCVSYLILANIFHSLSGKWPDPGVKFTSIWCIVCSILLIFEGWPGTSMLGINSPVWYLCVLLACYFWFYLFLYISRKTKISKLFIYTILLAFTIAFIKYNGIWSSLSGDAKRGYESFTLGVVMGCLLPYIDKNCCKNLGLAIICGSLFYCCSAAYFRELQALFNNQREFCMTALYPGLVLLSYGMKDLRCEKLEYLGKLSFEMFLWHCPTFVLIKIICTLTDKRVGESYFTMIVITFIVVLFSAFMLEKVEKPINRKIAAFLK